MLNLELINFTIELLEDDENQALINFSKEFLKDFIFKDFSNKENIKKCWIDLNRFQEKEIGASTIEVILLPLSRVGAQNGLSGSHVFVCYFRMKNANSTIISSVSSPFILKLNRCEDSREKLKEEYENSEKISPLVEDKYCALCLYYKKSSCNHFEVLWSLFNSNTDPSETKDDKLNLKEDNLWKHLVCNEKKISTNFETISKAIEKSYCILKYCHKTTLDEIPKTYKEEYKRYLRKYEEDKWEDQIINIWGDEPITEDFNIKYDNPIVIFNDIIQKKHIFSKCIIHGDLHPRNIVFNHDTINIIDFGWTDNSSHLAKDYVLMEANLRFMALHPSYRFDNLLEMAQSISNEDLRKNEEQYKILKLVSVVRNKYLQVDTTGDFLKDYIIPLFIVSFGLLKFPRDIENQISARLTVLELAKYIKKNYEE